MKNTGRCNIFSAVWAAIYGCSGEGAYQGQQSTHFARRENAYACPTCMGVETTHAKMSRPDRQADMLRREAAAGVVDYRTTNVKIVNGRPTLDI